MKFYDHFFSYYLLGNFNPSCNNLCFSFTMCFSNFIFILVLINLFIQRKEIIIRLILIIALLVVNIILYTLYKFIKFMFYNIPRIDFIYSKNFDRIFIGFVKYTYEKYVNTFEYQMDNIDKFIFEKRDNNNRALNLKVVFKNNEMQHICILKNKTQKDLE